MPIQRLNLRPGINLERTPTLNEGAWSACDRIRWRDDLPEPIGGWVPFYPTAMPETIRSSHAWLSLTDIAYLAVAGTNFVGVIGTGLPLTPISPTGQTSNLAPSAITSEAGFNVIAVGDLSVASQVGDFVYVNTIMSFATSEVIIQGLYEIAALTVGGYQIDNSTTLTTSENPVLPTFTTTASSAIVTIDLPSHGFLIGEQYPVAPLVSVGGLTLAGPYVVQTVPDVNHLTIGAPGTAGSGATVTLNSDQVQIQYLSRGSDLVTAPFWTMDNWGEILLLCPNGAEIYQWSPEQGGGPATVVGTGPAMNSGIFVAMPAQIAVAWGSDAGSALDPLLVRWSDENDYTDWTATVTNQAGSQRMPTGSKIVGALQAPQQAFIWTDIDVYAMTYVGPSFVFGFNKLGDKCGLAGPFAMTTLSGFVFWMGTSKFFSYNANGVQVLPCPVWDIVFQNLNVANIAKVFMASNAAFNEIWCFYPSATSTEVDSYVKMNVLLGAWDYGTVARTTWIDQSVLGQPVATDPVTGLIFQHETGTLANGGTLGEYLQSGGIQLSEGNEIVFVDWIIPDFKWGKYGTPPATEMTITPTGWMYPADTPTTFGPYTATNTTEYINPRIRARTIQIQLQSTAGGFWRLGSLRYRGAPDGSL